MSFWDEEWLNSDPEAIAHQQWRVQAAHRLREALYSVPFYAKRADKAQAEGGEEAELAYWLGLQASQMTLQRLPRSCFTAATKA